MLPTHAGGFALSRSRRAFRYREIGLITGHCMTTACTVASTPAGPGNAQYRGSAGRIADNIAKCPPLLVPDRPIAPAVPLYFSALAFMVRTRKLISCNDVGYPSPAWRKLAAATINPLAAST